MRNGEEYRIGENVAMTFKFYLFFPDSPAVTNPSAISKIPLAWIEMTHYREQKARECDRCRRGMLHRVVSHIGGITNMGLLTWTLLGTMSLPTQVPEDVVVWQKPTVQLPIEYARDKKDTIRELLLFSSTDQGQQWQQVGVALPGRDSFFKFTPPADGLYWVNMVTVDKSGNRTPADLRTAKPALKILIDTKKPVLTIRSAEKVGDVVTVSWLAKDANPDWATFALEQSADAGKTWKIVATRPEPDGTAQFKALPGANFVRIRLADLAKNESEMVKEITTTTIAAKPDENVTRTGGTGEPASGIQLPPVAGPDRRSNQGETTPEGPSVGGVIAPTDRIPPAPATPAAPTGTERNYSPVRDPLALPANELGTGTPIKNPIGLPQAQLINVTSFKLAYDVEDKGASGISRAEVWVTRDEGRNWVNWQTIEKPESPLVIDLARHERGKPGDAPKIEGIYGIKIVLRSGAGLSRGEPKPGDIPDLRVEVDTTAPLVKFFEPTADPTSKDSLILRWQAQDPNLADNPITLEWSDGPAGPWSPIAGDARGGLTRLANTGSYTWRLPSNFPVHKVYLRVTARDNAGNIAEFITKDPTLVDLNKPAAVKLNIIGGVSPR